MKKIFITGVNGLLGQKCLLELKSDYELIGCDIHDKPSLTEKFLYFNLDISDRKKVKNVIVTQRPDYIINAAAYTDVDGSEHHKELCWKINVEAVENLTYAAKKIDAKLIQISTDYVFNGENGPYRETDTPSPLGYYGKSKLASENILIQSDIEYAILRTMVLYGAAVNIRPNFVTWLIQKLSKNERVTIVNDQFGNPTLADDLARIVRRVIESEKWDLFHVSGNELLDRYSFALKIATFFDLDSNLISSISTLDLKQNALRPLNSGFILDKMKNELGMETLNVNDSLKLLKKQLKKIK